MSNNKNMNWKKRKGLIFQHLYYPIGIVGSQVFLRLFAKKMRASQTNDWPASLLYCLGGPAPKQPSFWVSSKFEFEK